MPAYVKICICGVMPERALLRLRRAEIPLRNVKKHTPTALLLTVRKKDLEKIFAIYPKTCYTVYGQSPYEVKLLGEVGFSKWLTWAKNRAGFILGALLFCILQATASNFVFGIEFVGNRTYIREALEVLETYGVTRGKTYVSGQEDLICSTLLRLRGVEFCSVKKRGLYVYVEMRINEERFETVQDGAFISSREGELLSITALGGTAVKNVGDNVKRGETLIDGYFLTPSGERVNTQVVGRAQLSCVYETAVQNVDGETAFATAYLQAEITEQDEVTRVEIQPIELGFAVRICFTATLSFNL